MKLLYEEALATHGPRGALSKLQSIRLNTVLCSLLSTRGRELTWVVQHLPEGLFHRKPQTKVISPKPPMTERIGAIKESLLAACLVQLSASTRGGEVDLPKRARTFNRGTKQVWLTLKGKMFSFPRSHLSFRKPGQNLLVVRKEEDPNFPRGHFFIFFNFFFRNKGPISI